MTRIPRPFSVVTGSGRRAQWRRRVLRRVLSAGLAACAVVLATSAARPAAGPTVLVLVAAREVPAGAVLAEGDVRPARVPGGAAQPGAITSPSEALGRRVAAGPGPGGGRAGGRVGARAGGGGPPPGRGGGRVGGGGPPPGRLLPVGATARVYPVAGGPPLAVGARVLTVDPAVTTGGALLPGESDPRGVVLSLSVAEADAVLRGHGALDGPVTVTVVGTG